LGFSGAFVVLAPSVIPPLSHIGDPSVLKSGSNGPSQVDVLCLSDILICEHTLLSPHKSTSHGAWGSNSRPPQSDGHAGYAHHIPMLWPTLPMHLHLKPLLRPIHLEFCC